jgi:hypothetical protein
MVVALIVAVLACAHADLPQTETAHVSVAANGSLIPLAARFVETKYEPDEPAVESDWTFIRSSERIETLQGDYAEIWERDDRGEITLKRVFHDDRKLVEYTTGELRAQRRLKEWSRLATILDERVLASLEQRGTTSVLKQPAVRYVGRLGNERVEVVWLTRQAIPAKVVRSHRGSTYSLEIRALRPAPEAFLAPDSREKIESYEVFDAADLGDREHELFVQKVLAMDSGRPGGHQHAH